MIFFSANQLYSFCLISACGIIFGLICGVLGVDFVEKHQKNIINFIFKFILSLFFSIFLIFSINLFYFGDFNIVIISAFILGFIWCRKTTQKMLDFFEIKFYHVYINLHKQIKFVLEKKHESIKD